MYKSLCTLPGFSSGGSICSQKKKKDNKEDAEEMIDFKHENHVQLSSCSVS